MLWSRYGILCTLYLGIMLRLDLTDRTDVLIAIPA
jgi:hypothetical protein